MNSAGLLTENKTLLRPFQESDVRFLFGLRNDVKLQMLLLSQPRPNSMQRVKEWVARISGDPQSLFFIIASCPDEQPLGYVQLTHMDAVHGTADLGICLAAQAQGQGHGRAAMRLLEAHAWNVFRLRKITLRVFADNAPAVNLYRRSGYRKAGVQRGHFYQSGKYHDVLIMEKFIAVPASSTEKR